MPYLNYIIFPIYLDYSSTTPVDPRVLEKIIPYFYYKFGNQKSRTQSHGLKSDYINDFYKKKISEILNCDYKEIIFNSSVTESNNIYIKSFCNFYLNKGKKIITLKIEHKSIIDILNFFFVNSLDVIYLETKNNGLLNLKSLKTYMESDNIILFALSYVNSELGVIQNIEVISLFCKTKKIVLYLDCTQAVGKMEINLRTLKVDAAAISSHKIYGPKGFSLLYLRRKSNIYFKKKFNYVKKYLKSITLQISQLVGFYESVLISKKSFFFENLKIKNFKNLFFKEVIKINKTQLNGDFKYRIPTNLNINLKVLKYNKLLKFIKFISISQSAACMNDYSNVLKFLQKTVNNSIRFSFGRFNNLCEIYFLIRMIFLNIFN